MKKILISAAAAAMLAAPAFAASMTVAFASEDGATAVWTFEDGTATAPDGTSAPYTFDEATRTLCADVPDQGEVCATFADETSGAVGDSSAYTLSTGGGGTATITAVTE